MALAYTSARRGVQRPAPRARAGGAAAAGGFARGANATRFGAPRTTCVAKTPGTLILKVGLDRGRPRAATPPRSARSHVGEMATARRRVDRLTTAALDDVLRELGALLVAHGAAAALAASSSGWARIDDPERVDLAGHTCHSATNQLYRWQERGWFEANARRDRALAANNYEATRWHGAHLTRADLKSELRKARAAHRAALGDASAVRDGSVYEAPARRALASRRLSSGRRSADAGGLWALAPAAQLASVVVFTAVTGAYDGAPPTGRLAGWEDVRHLCYTDTPDAMGGWAAAGWEVRSAALPSGVPPGPAAALARHQVPPVAPPPIGRPLRALRRRQHPEPLVAAAAAAPIVPVHRRPLLLLAPHGLGATDDPYDEAIRVAAQQLDTEENAFTTAARLAAAGNPRRWRGAWGGGTSLTEGSVSFRDVRSTAARRPRRGLRVTRGELDAARPAVDRLRAVAARRAPPPPPAPNDGAAAARRRGGGGRGRPEVRLGSRFTLEEIHVPDVIDTLVGRRSTRLSLQPRSTPCPVPAPPARPHRLTRRAPSTEKPQ